MGRPGDGIVLRARNDAAMALARRGNVQPGAVRRGVGAGIVAALLLGLVAGAQAASGFFVTADGYFVTSREAVATARRIVIRDREGVPFPARLIAADPVNDLVLLKARGQFIPLPLASSRRLRLGEVVYTPAAPAAPSDAPLVARAVTSLHGPESARHLLRLAGPVGDDEPGAPVVTASGVVVGLLSRLPGAAGVADDAHALRADDLLAFLATDPALAARLPAPPASGEPLPRIPERTVAAALGQVFALDDEGETAAPGSGADAAAPLGAALYEIGRRALLAKEVRTAARWLRIAAEHGHPPAQLALGNLLLDGVEAAGGQAEAVLWIGRAAVQGEAEAQVQLGRLLLAGRGVPADRPAALHWLRLAAEQGDPVGQRQLGLLLLDGSGEAGDPVQAAGWLRQAALQDDLRAQNALGLLFRDGRGVEADAVEAAWWFQQAAQEGDAEAQANLAQMHLEGRGVARDAVEALRWLRRAAAQGHPGAQAALKNHPGTP